MAKAKTNLTRAFECLRAEGFFARQNFTCCQSCGGAAACDAVENMIRKGKPKECIRGSVFYHAQDADSLRDGRDFYLAFGQLDTAEFGTVGMDTADVGAAVVQALARFGVGCEWDGNPATRIRVKAATVRAE